MNNKIYFLPSNSRVGCLGLLFGLIIISIVLFFSFFLGIALIGCFALYFLYTKILKKFFYKGKVEDNEKQFTEAEYIEINKKEEKND